ncbi:Oidioi.mRNA.OKI2018_I69.XSR.g15029.t1.cds [Oikopleura dioica]|uniref:receptor protein serine/threonine kinase n=1 Tax=Oikopleura dioica TaxID=34765 RepID=A0ABN7SGL4_OIKDI|nr:Oidioi.mRNA.OKI2018_I69.XSR.g15029.t1.cds [Oikopleura dioica]
MSVLCVCDQPDCPETGFCTTEGTCVTYYTDGGSERRCLDHDNLLHRGVCAFNSIKGSSTHVDCCKEDLCNNVKNAVSESNVSIYSDQANVLKLVISICGGFIIVILSVVAIKRNCLGRVKNLLKKHHSSAEERVPLESTVDHANTTTSAIDETSGSGQGDPEVLLRTITKDLGKTCFTGQPIGKGRYGEVWKASFKGRTVAIKCVKSTEGESFYRETNIYATSMLRHLNILDFIGADMRSCDHGYTELLLITAYHQLGSLYDFLRVEKIDKLIAVRLLNSALSGLVHLHCGIDGHSPFGDQNQGKYKVAIAHRDIKSRNILVKNDLTCCVADFGMAVKRNPDGKADFGNSFPKIKIGTRRYMAPEILAETINLKDFTAFQRADVYALGLLIWEITRCIPVGDDEGLFYEPAFFDVVSADPQFQEMENIICDRKMRPTHNPKWNLDSATRILAKLQVDCWCDDPSSRLPMVRIKKTVAKLESDLIEDMKAAGTDICEFIASKSSLFLKNQKEREEQTLREEQLAEEQRKYEEQLKRNVNNMTYSYIPQDYSQYRSTFPQPAYPLNWTSSTSTPLQHYPMPFHPSTNFFTSTPNDDQQNRTPLFPKQAHPY